MIMGETAQELARVATANLKAAGIPSAPLDARLIMRHVLGRRFDDVLIDPMRRLTDEEERRFTALLGRRTAREPLSHILGRREFWSLPFAVGPAVLDPRPDSETLIEAVLDHVKDARAPDGAGLSILDLGTGSGCLLLSLLHELPDAKGVGVDISADALSMARTNARRLGLDARATFAESDWTAGLSGRFDIVVSNPPYIRRGDIADLAPEVRDHEPHLALDGGADGLEAYRRIIPALGPLFSADSGRPSMAAFEVGRGQADDVVKLLSQNGFIDIECRNDLAGTARCVTGFKE